MQRGSKKGKTLVLGPTEGFWDIVGAHFRLDEVDGYCRYNRDAVIQFRHPDHAREAMLAIHETTLGDAGMNRFWAEPHFEEFNLKALDEVVWDGGAVGPRVSIAADPRFMFRPEGYWNVPPSHGLKVSGG